MKYTNSNRILATKDGQFAIIYSIVLMIAMFCPVANIESIPPELNFDKCIHISLFAILYGTWLKALKHRAQAEISALQISIAFGLFTEFVQALLPYRSAETYDLLCDFMGSLLGFIIVKYFGKKDVRASEQCSVNSER